MNRHKKDIGISAMMYRRKIYSNFLSGIHLMYADEVVGKWKKSISRHCQCK